MTDGPFYGRRTERVRVPARPRIFPTDDEVAARAHQLFVARGERLELLEECWKRAQDELLDRDARRIRALRAAGN